MASLSASAARMFSIRLVQPALKDTCWMRMGSRRTRTVLSPVPVPCLMHEREWPGTTAQS
eukprot:13674293-Heterocapsa_arctica.AAC.1